MIPKRKNEQIAQNERFKNRIIILLLIIVAFALWRIATYPKQLMVYTAPDISQSFVQQPGDVPASTIYGFSRTIWEALNYCADNCQADYPKSLDKYRAFLTKQCYAQLKTNFEKQNDLFGNRSRILMPTDASVFDVNRVKKVSSNTWYVAAEYLLSEDTNNITTRKQKMMYPLIVTANSTPTQYNPWGLALDCYWKDPEVIEYEKLEEIK